MMQRARRPPAAADRHRRAARHRPGAARELEGVSLYDIDDLQAVVARNLCARAERGAARARRSSRRRSTASRAGSASSRRCRPSARCASTATRSSSRCSPRTPAAGSRPRRARPRAHRGDRARRRSAGCCTSRRSACAASPSERGHASLELVRELFGLARTRPPQDARRASWPRCTSPRRRARARAAARGRRASRRVGARAGTAPGAARWRSRRRASASRWHTGRWRRATSSWCRSRPAATAARPGGQVALGRASSSRRCCAGEIDLAVHSAKDVPGELRRGPRAASAAPPRAAAEDALVRRAPRSTRSRRRARGHEQPAPRARSCSPRAPDLEVGRAARQRRHAPAQARRAARLRRDRARARRAAAARARGEVGAVLDPARFVPAPGQGTLALAGARADDAPARAAVAPISDARPLRLPARRARARARARRELPHAARRARRRRRRRVCGCARASACPTARPGSATSSTATCADPEALGRRGRASGCSPRARASCCASGRGDGRREADGTRDRAPRRRRARATPGC